MDSHSDATEIDVRVTFLAEIEAFLHRHRMSATRFGEDAARDGRFVLRLRQGRDVKASKITETRAWMRDYERRKP